MQTTTAGRPISTPKGETGDPDIIEAIFQRYSPVDRMECADRVMGSVPRDQLSRMKGLIVVADGYGSPGHGCVFRWLCVVAHLQHTSPLSVADAIVAAESAQGILL